MKKCINFISIVMLLFTIASCVNKKADVTKAINDPKIQKELQEKFINAKDGDVIELPVGKYTITKPLSVEGINNLTIKGKGASKTILSFLAQTDGAEGVNVANCNNITLEDFAVEDAKGDNIKLKHCDGVTLRHLNSTWTTGADTSNGQYGYYPVECKNVLIEDCEVSYCADAGVYVGQTTGVIVRRVYAHHNVAGIEIENCINSDIYDCKAENNSGGILVFDLPKLFQNNGRNARVWNNECINNNFKNFGKPGSIVSVIPPGSGMIIMATDSVEVFKNKFINNKSVGVALTSYFLTGKQLNDSTYGPYCQNIYIHDNVFSRKAIMIPDLSTDLGKLLTATFKKPLDIFVDGSADPKIRDTNGNLPADKNNCFRNNGDITFGNLNLWKTHGREDIMKYSDNDITRFDCSIIGIFGNKTPAK